ncbi:HD domain-containing protein [Solicola gregarius]|uniref:Metal-dependent HD superfamily phosphohydrolase n=1 Tax=Solicola gregarius TaxID=2908642 RepID=A0AA46YML3_9ACTN|nr:hypothetical protein [Solicola gregarius]UYM06734.1 hypothetical protein L0C25_06590 [Solicola gregarius]
MSGWQAGLERRWSEPHRHHHDRTHLADVLAALDELAAGGEPFDAEVVRTAAWFHDAVYDPRADDNEERSAELALELLPSDENPSEVARLVRITRTHAADAGDSNAAALCDADLSVLASDRERYDRYADNVRREYAHVPDADFHAGRAAILVGFLERAALFTTATGRARWESPARANLDREIATLRSR